MKPHLPLFRRGRKRDSDRKNGKRHRIDIQRAGLALATILILSVVLCMHLPDRISLAPGDIAAEDIRAHRSVRYLDTSETQRQKAEAALRVDKVYDRDPFVIETAVRELNDVFDAVVEVRGDKTLPNPVDKVTKAQTDLKNQFGVEVPRDTLVVLVQAREPVVKEMRTVTARLVRDAMAGDLKDDVADISRARAKITAVADDTFGRTTVATAVADLAKAVLRPNMNYDAQRTSAEKERGVAAVKPVYAEIESGELIVAKGQRVTQEHIEKFLALGLRQRHVDYRTVISLAVLVTFFSLLVIFFLARYQPQVYKSTRLLSMLALVVVVSTIGLKLGGGILAIKVSGLHMPYMDILFIYIGMMFITTAGMVLASLLNPQVAVLIVAMLSLVCGLVTNNELRYTTASLVSGLVAIYAVANIRGRSDLLRALGAIGITNVALVCLMGGLLGDSPADMFWGSVWTLFFAALPATMLFWFATIPLERMFRVTTHISLLELADTNKPILRRLVVEAPGTYTHSMAVGHLAEAAAEAIGADSLFARVASYYHDIGKIRRPHFFVENQMMENAHDRLNPTLSALVITSHIKDGLEVAREFKLPPAIQEIIVQHHGTSLVQYFYNQATGQVEPSAVFEQQFRYDGPQPQSKEAAIVMLADSVEAASRSLAKPSLSGLETLVRRVISDKMDDGQLNNCQLTFHDIGVIEQTFIRTLLGVLHSRIEYQEASESGKNGSNGSADQQQAETSSGPEPPQADGREAAAG
jgi:cyclic-di-AMP phosphodiesterase PgpH